MEVIVAIVNPAGEEILLPVHSTGTRHFIRWWLCRLCDCAYSKLLQLSLNELSAVEAAPLMCAGITTYNALRNSGARAGDLVAILGIGGLGHLGVQFAAKMGFRTIAIARGKDEEELVKKLGARQYIDNRSQNAVEELNKLGGAKVILATVPSGKAMSEILEGLAANGKIVDNWSI